MVIAAPASGRHGVARTLAHTDTGLCQPALCVITEDSSMSSHQENLRVGIAHGNLKYGCAL